MAALLNLRYCDWPNLLMHEVKLVWLNESCLSFLVDQCVWNCSRAVYLWLFSICFFVYVYQNCLQKNASTAMCMQTAAFLFCTYLFNFSSTLRSTERDRIKLCRLIGNTGVEGESALVMGRRGTSPWGSWHGKSWHLLILSTQSFSIFFPILSLEKKKIGKCR